MTSRSKPPAHDHTPGRVVAEVSGLLDGIDRVGADAPAAIAFRMAIKRKGLELVEAAGSDALASVLAKIRADAELRERILLEAWKPLMEGASA